MYKLNVIFDDFTGFSIVFRYRYEAADAAAAILKSQFVTQCSIEDLSSEEIERVFREMKGSNK